MPVVCQHPMTLSYIPRRRFISDWMASNLKIKCINRIDSYCYYSLKKKIEDGSVLLTTLRIIWFKDLQGLEIPLFYVSNYKKGVSIIKSHMEYLLFWLILIGWIIQVAISESLIVQFRLSLTLHDRVSEAYLEEAYWAATET